MLKSPGEGSQQCGRENVSQEGEEPENEPRDVYVRAEQVQRKQRAGRSPGGEAAGFEDGDPKEEPASGQLAIGGAVPCWGCHNKASGDQCRGLGGFHSEMSFLKAGSPRSRCWHAGLPPQPF